MNINRDTFFGKVRAAFGSLKQSQVNGFTRILDHWEEQGYTDMRWLAYMLATAWLETGATMIAIEEIGKGGNRKYGQQIMLSGKRYYKPKKIFYGRGLVQLTWYENYDKMGKLLGIDLLNFPEKSLHLDIAIKIMFEGMLKAHSNFGDFTGRCLEQYFNATINDPVGARKIINGNDKADLIAGYHRNFLEALTNKHTP
jgi:putative chitinase